MNQALQTPPYLQVQALGTAVVVEAATPNLDALIRTAANCRRADRLDAVLDAITAMGKMDADEMLEALRALEKAADGQTCGAMQECRQTVEGDMPAEAPEEPYGLLVHPNVCGG